MLARQVRIRLESWYPPNYTDIATQDHELELYLWIDGREAYQLFDYGPSEVLPHPGGSGGAPSYIHPEVLGPKFKMRLVAIERDGWLDAKSDSGGEITIDLDEDSPVSTWKIVADGGGDRPVEITLTIEYLTYVLAPGRHGPEPHRVDDKARIAYPWGHDARVFEHWLGLGQSSRIWADPARKYHEQVWFIVPLDGQGRRGKQVITTYRYDAGAVGLDHGRMSSVYIPTNTQIVLHEHDFGHPDFAAGKSLRLGNPGLHNLNETRWDDRVAAIELITTRFIAAAPQAPN